MGNCLGEYLAKSGNVPGGFLGILVVFFGGFLWEMVHIPEGILAKFCAILGSVPWYVVQPTCRMLETFRGQTGTLALGNFWAIVQRSLGSLPNSARILERLLRGVAQSSWGILACSWEFKKVLAKSLWLQTWAAPIITQSNVVSNGDHLKNCPSDFR